MAGPSDNVRIPSVAGRFYPAEAEQCLADARNYLSASVPTESKLWRGAVVPHAGWIYSAAIAGQTIATLAQQGPVDVVVIFGAIHTLLAPTPGVLDDHTRWHTPLGDVNVHAGLWEKLAAQRPLFTVDERLHRQEHSIEVQLPLVKLAWPDAAFVPVGVAVNDNAVEVGRRTARLATELKLRALFLGSTDLTHYGPDYGFTPAGIGPAALEWAKENDRRVLRLMTDMTPEAVVPEVRSRLNACGGGAIAATMAACREMGATGGRVLRHSNSYETLPSMWPQPTSTAVGYAGVLFG